MQPKNKGTQRSEHDEDVEEAEEGGLIRTCHLCGKAQCGQRRGRVRCAYCKRVFCLQQLFKKFKIKASVSDTDFKCPRCLGICCCVTNCQKGPPHVHCKVYKVRQNKRRNRELAARENAMFANTPPPQAVVVANSPGIPSGVSLSCYPRMSSIQHIPSVPQMMSAQPIPKSEMPLKREAETAPPPGFYPLKASSTAVIPLHLAEAVPVPFPDNGVSGGYINPADTPQLQHNDWLTQLNLKALDGDGEGSCVDIVSSQLKTKQNQGFVNKLRSFFSHRSDYSGDIMMTIQAELMKDAMRLQSKAEKSDILLKMVENFNNNTIHATISWQLVNNTFDPESSVHSIPSLYTIVNCCPTVLFNLEINTNYGESDPVSSVSITFFDTSAIKDIRPLCTCIALMNGAFQHYHDVKCSESWTEDSISWKSQENIDANLLATMIAFGQTAQATLDHSETHCRVVVSYSRSLDDNSVENLPILSLILKRVSADYPGAIYSLDRMMCNEHHVVCVLVFSEERNWVKIINGYQSSLDVCIEEQGAPINRINSQPVLIDL